MTAEIKPGQIQYIPDMTGIDVRIAALEAATAISESDASCQHVVEVAKYFEDYIWGNLNEPQSD